MNASSFFSVTHVSWHWMSSEWDASDSNLISLPLLHVQSSKPSCPGMTLTAAIPFRGQADRFKPSDRMVYECIPSPHYPHLIPLYEKIYLHKDRTYCKQLEQETAKWRRRLNASMWTIKNTHILQKSSTAVRHLQLVINDYCQNCR